ncbi:MAG: hypothetical protein SO314_00245 [Alphaproteobacteria bacterium]|nr:hypothetical protein [Alphaproteobacteria bacterium]
MSDIENIKQQIADVKYEIGFVKTALEDFKRRYNRDKDLIWEDYRQKSDELANKISDAREKMNYFENEIQWRKDKIRDLQSNSRDQDDIYRNSDQEIDRMRYDDIPDNEQTYDFMHHRREAELADRRREMNQDEIRRYEDEITDFNNRYFSTESDIGDYGGREEILRQDKRDRLYQAKVYYDDLASADRGKMRDLLHRLDELEQDLEAAYRQEHMSGPKTNGEYSSESYQYYLDDKFIADENDFDRDTQPKDRGPSYSLDDFSGRPQEEYIEPEDDDDNGWNNKKVDDYYMPAQGALKDFARKTGRTFHEQTGRQGYKASVGHTEYNYQNKNRLEITRQEEENKKAVPSIEDFVTALLVEKNNGKTVINVSKADSDEYRARLMIASQKVGLRTRGYTKIEDVNGLDEHTCEMLKKMPDAEKNQELLARLRQRKRKTPLSVADNNLLNAGRNRSR